MFTGSGTLEQRTGSLLIYRDRTNGTLIYWYGAPRDADIEDPAVWYACEPDLVAARRQVPGRPVRQASRPVARSSSGAATTSTSSWVRATAWLRPGAWRRLSGDLPLNVALPVGVGIDRSPDGELGAIVVAQRQADRVVVRSEVFAPESATGIGPPRRCGSRLRELRAEYPLAQVPRPEDEAGDRRARVRARPDLARRDGRTRSPRTDSTWSTSR